MELYENRIINGLLKARAVDAPEEATQLLSRDIEIVAEPSRATEGDLWPAIWSLAATLERQFSGAIHIHAGLSGPLSQPARLGARCSFGTHAGPDAIFIHLGLAAPPKRGILCGDARGGMIAYGSTIDSLAPATPIDCFALSGYLGFAALAHAVGIPSYRQEFATPQLTLPFNLAGLQNLEETELDFVGLGQLGQAFIALLFFVGRANEEIPRIYLVDKDHFEKPNWSTQILIEPDSEWMGVPKAEYLRHRTESWGRHVHSDITEITWGWRRPSDRAGVGILGLDKFEVRRMAIAGEYSWIFDAGLGNSFIQPRVSWHSIPADNSLAKALFPNDNPVPTMRDVATPFLDELRNTPGACGLLTFEQTQASAPCMGLAAAAFLWSEVSRYLAGAKDHVQGTATLWSPILPPLRSNLNPRKC